MLKDATKCLTDLLNAADFKGVVSYLKKHPPAALLPEDHADLPLEERLLALRFRSMSAEAYDSIGHYDRAAAMIKDAGETSRKELASLLESTQPALSEKQRLLRRQQVWVLIHTGMSEYRRGRFEMAYNTFNLCDQVCRKFVVNSEDYAWGTQARIQYCIGLAHREMADSEAAIRCFSGSVECAYKSLRKKDRGDLTYLAIAKNLGLGLAYVYSDTGRPDLAFPLLVAAKSILQHLGETLVSGYIDLIYANVLRAKASSHDQNDDIIQLLQASYDTFEREGHALYKARTSYYLSLAFLYRARPDESVPLSHRGAEQLQRAERFAEEIKGYSESGGDNRFELYRYILKSRIARKRDDLESALYWARMVLGEKSIVRDGVLMEALLAQGEARERKGNFEAAVEDFQKGLETTRNPRIKAVCLLHLCRLYALHGDATKATGAMVEFERIQPSVTHAQIPSLERRARAALEQTNRDVLLRLTDDGINAGAVEQRVRQFLVDWAKARAVSDSEAARLLGVSRQTLYNWTH